MRFAQAFPENNNTGTALPGFLSARIRLNCHPCVVILILLSQGAFARGNPLNFGDLLTTDEERKIIGKVIAGDRNAYALLVNAYQGPVFNLAYRMTLNYEDAGDLAQETFLKAYLHLRSFDTGKSLFTWIYTIALNLTRNHLKKKGRERAGEIIDKAFYEAGGGAQAEGMIRSQEILQMESCLLKLPVALREAIVLRYYQDLSYDEAAAILNSTASAVKMRVYRGLEKLKQLMEDKAGGAG